MIEVLKRYPDGITAGEWRRELGLQPEEQNQLDRRKRDLYKWFHIERAGRAGRSVYRYRGERARPLDAGPINLRVQAEIRHKAHGRCQMCGRTLEEDGIKLEIDHKIPQQWGGLSEPENLWALCQECNQGKKNYFDSQDTDLMKRVMPHKSVHVRIGELLKANVGKPVPSYLIEFVANQDDWMKRTRELRYLGWKVSASRKRIKGGRVVSTYTLREFSAWPNDPSGWIRRYEKSRAEKNRSRTRSRATRPRHAS